MIQKNYGKFSVICDVCGDRVVSELESFEEAKEEAWEDGWRKKVDGEWMDVCDDCQTYVSENG